MNREKIHFVEFVENVEAYLPTLRVKNRKKIKMFPKYNNVRVPEVERQIVADHQEACERKQIEFRPLSICEFFTDMDVLQIRGEESGELVFGIYFGGRLVGHVYLGDLYSHKQLIYIVENFLPKHWNEIDEYARTTSEVWYAKFDPSQYAWIYERILTKID